MSAETFSAGQSVIVIRTRRGDPPVLARAKVSFAWKATPAVTVEFPDCETFQPTPLANIFPDTVDGLARAQARIMVVLDAEIAKRRAALRELVEQMAAYFFEPPQPQ